jgi:phosphatidylinositol kinase/protein kinase (PI-3  family)
MRAVSQENLRKAWESAHRCTKEDWTEWLRRLSVELLAHSSSPALRSCHQLARVQPTMARELFSVGFVSCWLEIDDQSQRELVRSLEAALVSPSIPPEIVTALLNLAEFMEHNERPLPLDTRTLGALAEKCHAYAKVRLLRRARLPRHDQSCIKKSSGKMYDRNHDRHFYRRAMFGVYGMLVPPRALHTCDLHVQIRYNDQLHASTLWLYKHGVAMEAVGN